ncbi:hypothetical protein LC608_31675 [Nostoc sp. XA010]|uniref:hypothetical protein n=1 Tax=Nostoc sp. XA010 TaxID=2780407 RepID=UPI001E566A1F|nr:hypothetical protein [Nostoc sp. XA010]MCC5661433.1 hypothetical protein [Nostoc sp. XA010]
MSIKTLEQAIKIWANTKSIQNTPLINNLKIALKSYILPTLNHEVNSLIFTENFDKVCCDINLSEFTLERVLNTFEQACDNHLKNNSININTKENYRSAIIKFFKWLQTQDWYREQSTITLLEIFPKIYAHKTPSKTYNGNREYGLKEENLSPKIYLDLKEYEKFWSQNSHSQYLSDIYFEKVESQAERRIQRLKQAEQEAGKNTSSLTPSFRKLETKTLLQYKEYILRFLGWCVNIEGYDIEDLYLDLITIKSFYQTYIAWLIQHRSCETSVALKVLGVSVSVAKYKTFKKSQTIDWSDIPLVTSLREQRNMYANIYQKDYPKIQEKKWDLKYISHVQAQEVVEYIYHNNCSFKRYYRDRDTLKTSIRNLSSVVNSWQNYLMIKFLVYVPVRQEELRKLVIGTTLKLIVDSQGNERYAVKIKYYKNSSKKLKPRYYPLPHILTADITTWIEEIRPLALQAPETVESWVSFWGYSLKTISTLERKIQENEMKGIPDDKYYKSLQVRLRAKQNRSNARNIAKENARNCNHLFFSTGHSNPEKFACSFENIHYGNVSERISQVMGNTTFALFGEAKFLNPHGFRNIAAKHLRQLGKHDEKDAFSALLGHSVEIDNDYADVVTSDYDLIECVVDNWWE